MKTTRNSLRHLVLVLVILSILASAITACGTGGSPAGTTTATTAATAAAAVTTATAAATTVATTAAVTTAKPTTPPTTAMSAAPAKLSGPFTEADLVLTIDGQSFTLLSDSASLLKKLGSQYQKTEAESCVYKGFDKTFDYGFLQIYTIPKDQIDLLDGIYLMDKRYKTARGIQVGDPLSAVLEAYGEIEGEEGSLVYNQSGDPANLSEPNMTFVIEEDKVTAISYYSGSNAQGAGNGG